jgi:hypothetical protein
MYIGIGHVRVTVSPLTAKLGVSPLRTVFGTARVPIARTFPDVLASTRKKYGIEDALNQSPDAVGKVIAFAFATTEGSALVAATQSPAAVATRA